MNCRLCSSNETKLLFSAENVHGRHVLSNERFGVYECRQCGVSFTDVRVDGSYYKKYYPENYYSDNQPRSLIEKFFSVYERFSFQQRLKLIGKYKPRGNRILEIGCAKGRFLHFLPVSFEKYGVEINESGYRFIKENYKEITVYNTRIDDEGFNREGVKFDVIVMWHVLEHVDNPDSFLKKLSGLLGEDGVIIFEIPNRNSVGFNFTREAWFHLDTPRHLFYYNCKSLVPLLKKYGLEPVRCTGNPIDYFQDLAFSFYNKLMAKETLTGVIAAYLILPFALIVRLLLSLLTTRLAEVNTYIVKREMAGGLRS